MHITHELLIDCSSMTAAECSDRCLAALGHGVGFNLKAAIPTDTVHGSVSIVHADLPHPHMITVECYDTDQAPTAVRSHGQISGRQSTLKRPVPMPTADTLKARLNAMPPVAPKP